MKFNELKLDSRTLETLHELGFEEPTPIQQQSIPVALEGRDMIGQAQTGTGKTAAFGLPMLELINPEEKTIQGLVVAPTRELAIQVQEELFRLGKGVRARVFPVYGGAPIGKQIERIKRNNPQVIVGTPGRIIDLIKRRVLKLDALKMLVLDEADEMLNMGFIDDIREIFNSTPASRQTMLFSATMPPAVKKLGQQFLTNPEHVKIEAKEMTADLIDQYFIKSQDNEKFDILTRLIDTQSPTQSIIFCRTKKRVDEVGRGLSLRGYNSELIHGDVTQQKRTSVIKEFRQGNVEILVATDVAARGLDISGVTHVYNYDIPQDPESYVHRIGRTGRAGADGMSITFVIPNEMDYLRTIENLTRKQMTPMRPPTDEEAQQGQIQAIVDQVNDILEEGNVDHLRNSAKVLLNHYETNDLVAGLLSQLINDANNVEVFISPQKPLPNPNKKSRGGNKGGGNYRGKRRRNDRGRGGQRRDDRRGGGNRDRKRDDRNRDNRSKDGQQGRKERSYNKNNKNSKNFKIKQKND